MDFCSLCCVMFKYRFLIDLAQSFAPDAISTLLVSKVSHSQSNLMIIGLNISMATAASTTDVGL